MIDDQEIRLHARVEGRVQGVGFRAFVCEEAQRLGLDGWVRNCPDGSVELEAQGNWQEVHELHRAIGEGPTWASVKNVIANELPPGRLPKGFRIRY